MHFILRLGTAISRMKVSHGLARRRSIGAESRPDSSHNDTHRDIGIMAALTGALAAAAIVTRITEASATNDCGRYSRALDRAPTSQRVSSGSVSRLTYSGHFIGPQGPQIGRTKRAQLNAQIARPMSDGRRSRDDTNDIGPQAGREIRMSNRATRDPEDQRGRRAREG